MATTKTTKIQAGRYERNGFIIEKNYSHFWPRNTFWQVRAPGVIENFETKAEAIEWIDDQEAIEWVWKAQ